MHNHKPLFCIEALNTLKTEKMDLQSLLLFDISHPYGLCTNTQCYWLLNESIYMNVQKYPRVKDLSYTPHEDECV